MKVIRCVDCGEQLETGIDGPLRCERCDPDAEERERRQCEQDAYDAHVDAALGIDEEGTASHFERHIAGDRR